MNNIRLAKDTDTDSFLKIKNQLPLIMSDGKISQGGFLLGTDKNTYLKYIQESLCMVAEVDGEVVGFGIIINNTQLRDSDIWQRRHQADWLINIDEYEEKNLCYFEQLAFLKGHRILMIRMVYQMMKMIVNEGVEFMFTTTVHKPIINLAAVPFILSVEGKKAGSIDESYPIIGDILSDIYIIDLSYFQKKLHTHTLYPYLQKFENPSS